MSDEEEERKGAVNHIRKTSRTALDQKTFNMAQLAPVPRRTSDELLARKELLADYNSKVVPYKRAINYIKLDQRFMLKGQLMEIKIFPMRECQVLKSKIPRPSVDLVGRSAAQEQNWRMCVYFIIGVVLLFMVLIVVIVAAT